MATAVVDSEALRNELNQSVAGGTTPGAGSGSPEIPSGQPSESPSGGDAASPSDVQPSQAQPEGITPPAQPPAPAAPQGEELFQRLLARFNGDVGKATQAFYDQEQRASKYAKENEELKAEIARLTGRTPPSTQQPPRPVQPATPTPVPQVAAPDTQIEAIVEEAVQRDPQCVAMVSEFRANSARMVALAELDPNGQPTGHGELPDLDEKIRMLDLETNNERRAKFNLPPSTLDEFQRQDLAREMQLARLQRSALIAELHDRQRRDIDLRRGFSARREGYRQRALSRAQEQQREAESIAQRAADEASFAREWVDGFHSVVQELQVTSPELADTKLLNRIWATAKNEAYAMSGELPEGQIRPFILSVVKRELATVDEYHRLRSEGYARLKLGDAAPSAPRGAAAVAAPLPTESSDPDRALRAQLKASPAFRRA